MTTRLTTWRNAATIMIYMVGFNVCADPLIDPANPKGGYPTVVAAVKAASDRYNPDSIRRDREHYGAILRKEGATPRFFYTHQVAARRSDSFRFSVSASPDHRVVAIWHTHGSRDQNHRYFSYADTRCANRLRLPFYLADYTGVLKVYRPGKALGHVGHSLAGLSMRPTRGSVVRDSDDRAVRIRTRGA